MAQGAANREVANFTTRRVLLALVTLLLAAVSQTAPPPDGSSYAGLMREVERIRGLKFTRAVPKEIVSSSRMKEVVREQLAIEYPEREIAKIEETLKAFGLIPKKRALKDILGSLLEEQVMGLYDPRAKKLYICGDGSQLEEELLAGLDLGGFSLTDSYIIHELDHALTDQHFDLLSLPVEEKFDQDRAGAAMAVVEGDATWVMYNQIFGALKIPQERMEGTDQLLANLSMMGDLMGGSYPKYLQQNLMSAYLNGFSLVKQAYAKGGTPGVDALYRRLPESMEQVLHPEKYFAGVDHPARLTVKLPPAWTSVGVRDFSSGTWGELNTRIILDGWGSTAEAAATASAGWGGDAYVTARTGGGGLAWVWATKWDTDKDAAEFRGEVTKIADLKVYFEDRMVTVVRGGPQKRIGALPEHK